MCDAKAAAGFEPAPSPLPTDLTTADVYGAVVTRYNTSDTNMWQVPGLSIAASAFLLNITLDPTLATLSRVGAALLAVLVSALAMLLMAKHRQAAQADFHYLAAQEEPLRHLLPGRELAHGADMRRRRLEAQVGPRWLRGVLGWRAFNAWIWGLSVFLLASVVLAVLLLLSLVPALHGIRSVI